MNKYIEISLKSNSPVTHKERKRCLTSLYGNASQRRFGMIDKFVKAVGFNDVYEDYVSQYPVVEPPKVTCPEDYTLPNSLLKQGLHVDLSENGMVKFVVPTGWEKFEKYSYSHKELCMKFAMFLAKVYPELNVDINYLEDFEQPLQDFAIDFFYQGMDEDIKYTVEFSSHRLLESSELEVVEKVLREVFSYNFKIQQHYCETCAFHHPEYPYHIEVEYL